MSLNALEAKLKSVGLDRYLMVLFLTIVLDVMSQRAAAARVMTN
jgi:hypothetical protein